MSSKDILAYSATQGSLPKFVDVAKLEFRNISV